MKELFIQIVNMSITASWLVLAIALIRLVFKKAPKSMICFLWLFVAIRLVVPFSFESALSLIPSTNVIPEKIIEVTPDPTVNVQTPSNPSGNDVQIVLPNQNVNENITTLNPSDEQIVSVRSDIQWMDVLPWVWVSGMMVMAGYALYSYQKIGRQVQASINKEDNIWICDELSSPFILGVVNPKIYVPSYLSETEMKYVLAHERAHLKRFDHLWKPLGYTLLSIYWFNPVIWAAYLLLCSDIELACDEKVIKTLGDENKVEYSRALLSCSVPRNMILACPLAFGEVSVKQRVQSVLNYKKPAFWVLVCALMICLAVPVFFLSDPLSDEEIIESNTIHFLETIGEFAQEAVVVDEQFTTLYNQRIRQTSDSLSQEKINQIVQEASDETYGVFLEKVALEFSYMTDEQVQKMHYNRMFAWPFNEEYTVVFDQVIAYESSWTSSGYAVFEDSKWRFDISWVKENFKIKMTGFNLYQVDELTG